MLLSFLSCIALICWVIGIRLNLNSILFGCWVGCVKNYIIHLYQLMKNVKQTYESLTIQHILLNAGWNIASPIDFCFN